jgi:CheY-like chemotaxis protein
MSIGTVLIVESQEDARRTMADWLEAADFEVLLCPGPGEPDYICLGGRGLACPLAQPADVVVVSMRLRSDDMMQGTPGWVLLSYYAEQGKRVVALTSERDAIHPLSDEQVTVLTRPVDRQELVDAVGVLAHRR